MVSMIFSQVGCTDLISSNLVPGTGFNIFNRNLWNLFLCSWLQYFEYCNNHKSNPVESITVLAEHCFIGSRSNNQTVNAKVTCQYQSRLQIPNSFIQIKSCLPMPKSSTMPKSTSNDNSPANAKIATANAKVAAANAKVAAAMPKSQLLMPKSEQSCVPSQ